MDFGFDFLLGWCLGLCVGWFSGSMLIVFFRGCAVLGFGFRWVLSFGFGVVVMLWVFDVGFALGCVLVCWVVWVLFAYEGLVGGFIWFLGVLVWWVGCVVFLIYLFLWFVGGTLLVWFCLEFCSVFLFCVGWMLVYDLLFWFEFGGMFCWVFVGCCRVSN